MTRRLLVPLFLCLLVPLSVGVSHAQTPQERAQVETFLRDWQRTSLVADEEFEKLKPIGKHLLPLLASYLNNKELGLLAESTMQRIDANGAMPYLLKNLLNRDPNIQRDTFRLANRQMLEYDWYVRSGKPPVDTTQPPPRYPSNTKPYPYRREMHDAARKCLEAEDQSSPISHALQTLGLTGNRRDIPLLRKYAKKEGGAAWEGTYPVMSIAALARLGDKEALDAIAAALEKSVPPQPAAPYQTDSGATIEAKQGAVVASREDGQRIRTAAMQAGFSMNRRLIPFLLRHLDDPPGQFHGDYADPSPAREAMQALSQIICGLEYGEQAHRTAEEWKQWGREHEKEFTTGSR